MGESWGDLTAGEYMFSHGYSNGANPWAVGPYATGNKTTGIRDYAINTQPAELLRLRLRLHRRRGPRRRRDLERHPVGGPPGPGRRSTTRSTPTTDKALQLRCAQAHRDQHARCRPTSARATAAGSSWSSTPSCSSRAPRDARRPRRDAGRRPDALRRRQPGRCGTPSPAAAWAAAPRRPNADSGDPTPELRLADSRRNATVTFTAGRAAPGQGLRRRLRGPRPPRSPTPTPTTHARARSELAPGTYQMLLRLARRAASPRFTLTVDAGPAVTEVVRARPPEPGRRGERRQGARLDRGLAQRRRPSSTAPRRPTGPASTRGQRRRRPARRSPSTSPARRQHGSSGSRSARC